MDSYSNVRWTSQMNFSMSSSFSRFPLFFVLKRASSCSLILVWSSYTILVNSVIAISFCLHSVNYLFSCSSSWVIFACISSIFLSLFSIYCFSMRISLLRLIFSNCSYSSLRAYDSLSVLLRLFIFLSFLKVFWYYGLLVTVTACYVSLI